MSAGVGELLVADLFSGAGGMSYGFHAHAGFRVVGAADAQIGKPSSKRGSLGCNGTYRANVGISPMEVDLGTVAPAELRRAWGLGRAELDVLAACPPCTGFSAAGNTSRRGRSGTDRDDPRNALVSRVAGFVAELRPSVVLMENAKELVRGALSHHYGRLKQALVTLGYSVLGEVHVLSRFGLPQARTRALVVAVKDKLPLRGLSHVWAGRRVADEAVTVRRAIGHLPYLSAGQRDARDPAHVSPPFRDERVAARMRAIPPDGGSWADLLGERHGEALLNPAQHRLAAAGRFGDHPDVYGRLWWDRPAVTIKRECAHVGNGRYAHPEQHRLCSVRELALLQGFPAEFKFDVDRGLSNAYRHVGDAVPPLVSYQLAGLVSWILGGPRPSPRALCLRGASLRPADVVATTA